MNIPAKFQQLLSLLGQPVEVSDPTALDQCMDLAFKWCQLLGIEITAIFHPYAYQVWTIPTDATVAHFYLIPNTPHGVPQQGDMPVFAPNVAGVTSGAGHICVATGQGDSNSFKSLDENWNGKQFVTEETHAYNGVLGWLRPIQLPVAGSTLVEQPILDKLATESSLYEDFLKGGYGNISDVIAKVQQLSDQITTLQTDQGQMALATQQDKSTIAQLGDKIVELGTKITEQAAADSTLIDAGITAQADLKEEQQKNKVLTADLLTVGNQLGNIAYPPIENYITRIAQLEKEAMIQKTTQLVQPTISFLQKVVNVFHKK